MSELRIEVNDGVMRTPEDPCRFRNRCGRGDANLWLSYAGAWMSRAASLAGQDPQRIADVGRMASQYAQLLRSDTCTYLSADCTPLVRTAISLTELAHARAQAWADAAGLELEPPERMGWETPPASLPIPADTRDKLRELDQIWARWLASVKAQVQDKVSSSIPWVVLGIAALIALRGDRW